MKKNLVLTLLIVSTFMLTACGNTPQANTETITETNTDTTAATPDISFEEEGLILAYCSGTWDGTLLLNDDHCASIEDGILWIDCWSTDRIVDMGPYDEDTYWSSIIESSEEGSWIFNSKLSIVEYWKNGFRKAKFGINTESAYATSVFKLEDCFLVRCGSSLQMYDLWGSYLSYSLNDVVDVYQTEDGILCSTFEHKNLQIRGAEEEDIEVLETSYVRFHRSEGKIETSEEENLIVSQASNLFYNEGWGGEFRRLNENTFIAIDYNGDIIVNNKMVGNVCLGNNVITSGGPNIYLDIDRSYWLDGTQLVSFQHGSIERKVDVPDGTAKFLRVYNNYTEDGSEVTEVTIAAQTGDTVYIVENDGTVKVISEGVVDARVAYDTLYYMVGNTVYALDWLDPEATPEIFFDGAYAVSPHTDETEGALVPQQKSNYTGYGYSNIYSPYGIAD